MRLLGILLAAKAVHTGVVCGLTGRPYSFPQRTVEHPVWKYVLDYIMGDRHEELELMFQIRRWGRA